ncbi:glycosyltransferase, group 1 family protein [Blautia hydrogenotrophica DSM 10507]|uniref:Glycosyl transferase family 1 domain-containing protein n=3 Tax=Blautia hydrogenotrophica TaxID=53443 RepID=C0CGX0_BLAHS|nr:glycosyltransferase, group 1 family protein [Blautia hydrogenotrophica DSM 10507]
MKMRQKNNIPIFLCELPPPYGGVTVKNQLIINYTLQLQKPIDIIDLYECKRNKKSVLKTFGKIIISMLTQRRIIYGFGSYKRLKIVIYLQRLCGGKKSLRMSKNIVMGGVFQDYIRTQKCLKKLLIQMKTHYVETEGMKAELEKMGFSNIEVFPNPKSETGSCPPQISKPNAPLRLVYFSQISKEKGVKDIIDLVSLLDRRKTVSYCLDFYGHIKDDIKTEFCEFIKESPYVRYCGIFDSTKSNVYQKLNTYDILLFPTHWDTEGVPGILIEAKMAGLAIIASNCSYNKEIIQINKKEGFLVYNDYPCEMYKIIKQLENDKNLLYQIKTASFQSRIRYRLDEYKDIIKSL